MANQINCPICNHILNIDKVEHSSGMDGRYYNWRVECSNCYLINIEYAADSFYGREYYRTKDEVIEVFNKGLEKVRNKSVPEIVYCKDCKWRGKVMEDGSIEWPDKELFKCPGQVDDHYYDWIPDDDFYCANGERRK